MIETFFDNETRDVLFKRSSKNHQSPYLEYKQEKLPINSVTFFSFFFLITIKQKSKLIIVYNYQLQRNIFINFYNIKANEKKNYIHVHFFQTSNTCFYNVNILSFRNTILKAKISPISAFFDGLARRN